MTFNKRLKAFIKKDGRFNVSSLEKEIGKSNGYISNTDNYSMEVLKKIAEIYETLNFNWLISGEGEMELPKTKTSPALGDTRDGKISGNKKEVKASSINLSELSGQNRIMIAKLEMLSTEVLRLKDQISNIEQAVLSGGDKHNINTVR